ncbi:hypothetical protein F5B19DRAFT_501186 [Rostrohypoxylon terebratum]|nr:hypothetical protein F5B19DRAFT_501186 [Rostrohypoxylon terebratum]
MTSSIDQQDYSTLEVDTEAQNRHLAEEAARAAQAPEVNQHATEHYNYPEVVTGGAPKLDIDPTLPEPVQIPEKDSAGVGATAAAASPKICGIKRKFFWTLLVAVILVIAIIVGVTAGVVVTKKNKSDSSSNVDDSTDSTVDATALYAKTNLATANFTDEFNNENYLVVYQLNNKAIYMSAWNSSQKTWVVSPIVDGKTNNLGLDSVKMGTALSLDVFAYSNSARDLHVYWQLPDSGGLSTIKALTYTSDKGVTTRSPLPAANWVDSAAGNSYISTAGSSLVSYGKACDMCNQYTYLYWQTSAGIREASLQNASIGWYSDTNVIAADAAAPSGNSSLAQAYAAAATTDGHRSMNIFYRATTSALSQIINGDGRYVGASLGRDIGPDTTIAAFSTGFNETSANITDKLGFQVLTMDPAASNGVQLTYFKGGNWTSASNEVSSLSDCKERRTMVANHAQRVYCLVSSGSGVEIVEYAWEGDPDDVSMYSNYNKIGTVGVSAS